MADLDDLGGGANLDDLGDGSNLNDLGGGANLDDLGGGGSEGQPWAVDTMARSIQQLNIPSCF